jgi:hypothetical protein
LGKVLKNPKEIKGHVYGLEDSQKCWFSRLIYKSNIIPIQIPNTLFTNK